MNDKFLSFLGIAKRAGSLILGMDEVKSKLLSAEVNMVMVTSDISSNSLEKIESFVSEKFSEIKLIKLNYTKDDIDRTIGKYAAVIGVSNINIARKICLILEQKSEGNDVYNDKI